MILMIFAYAKTQPDGGLSWMLKIHKDSFVDIGCIYDHIGDTASLQLPAFHSVTGSDCTSFFYRASKKQVFSKWHRNDTKMNLLSGLGQAIVVTADTENNVQQFIQKCVYSVRVDEVIVDTRMRQYNNLKVKTTKPIVPDPDSLCQHIKRANIVAYYWCHCIEAVTQKISPHLSGWKLVDKVLKPNWFTGFQLPEVLRGRRTVQRSSIQYSEDADDEGEAVIRRHTRKSRQRQTQAEKSDGYSAEAEMLDSEIQSDSSDESSSFDSFSDSSDDI